MAQRQVVLTFQKSDTKPPVFVAGTFSSPPWQPQEMDYSVDKQGNHTFEKVVSVRSGAAIQYKFRLGTGDWWVCDDNTTKATDAQGNLNNVLRMSALSVDIGDFDDVNDSSEDTGPMLSHESFSYHDDSPYSASSDDGVTTPSEPTFRFPNSFKPTFGSEKDEDDIDFNDPTLEHFPHDNRRSIIAELQRIETATEPDRSVPEGIPPSPLVSPMGSTFPPSIHEPDSPKRRVNAPRAALGSFHSERSHISLASIDENLEEESDDEMAHNLQVPDDGLHKGTFDSVDFSRPKKSTGPAVRQVEPSAPIVRLETPSVDHDEGISLNTGNSTTRSVPAQDSKREDDLPPNPPSDASAHSVHDDHKKSRWLQSFLDSTGQLVANMLFGNRTKT
ncbi:hypothetical protein LQW54_003730 [Pestalotiopsis sp. IQ-011]